MTIAQSLATFVVRSSFDDLTMAEKQQLKICILDSLGCAIGALDGEPIRFIRQHIFDFGGEGHSTLIGGGRTSPDRAAFYNSALTRYLDFNDFYLAKGESCHPSDNLGPVLAALEYSGGDGKDLMTALAVAYQVQARLSDEAPVRAKGFDHTTQGSYAVAAGVSKALRLDVKRTTNAIALSGTPFNALRVTRTGALSHWKGLAYPNTAFSCTHATFLAMRGITGPPEVFEGNKGFMHSIAGQFHVDWATEKFDRVNRIEVKKYNAEGHSQQTVEGVLELQQAHGFSGSDIDKIDIETFDVAFSIIGGGEEGDKTIVRNKEEADHSLHYMVAVALLDGNIMPEQYEDDRIVRPDVQDLLKRVFVQPNRSYSDRFPDEMVTLIKITLKSGMFFVIEKTGYEGFHASPMKWETVVQKFKALANPYCDRNVQDEIISSVQHIETISVKEFIFPLTQVTVPD